MLQVGRTYTNSEKGSTYILRTMKAKVEWKNRNETEKEKENALNEVRILASIRHPNIIGYKEAFLDEASNSLW